MKKILFLLVVSILSLVGCSKGEDDFHPKDSETESMFSEKRIYNETGCHVTGAKDITYLDKLFTTPNGEKYLYGSKNDKFWFSKYTKEGNLLWESTDPYNIANKDTSKDDGYPLLGINTRAVNPILLSNGNLVVGYAEEESKFFFERILPVIFPVQTGKPILTTINENNEATLFKKKGYIYNRVSVFDDFFLCTLAENDMITLPYAYPWSLLIKNDGTIIESRESIVFISSISLDVNSLSLLVGNSYTLKTSLTPEDADVKSLVWKSSDNKIATVKEGVITGVSKGECTITAHSKYDKSIKAECMVKITSQSIIFDKSDIKMLVNDIIQIEYTLQPETLEIQWKSSDDKVVTVIDGELHAMNIGEVDITATSADGEVKAVCHVSVGDISSMISLTLSSAGIYIDGYFTGSFYSSINNGSNKEILLTRFEIKDSKTNKVVAYTEKVEDLGVLAPESSRTLGSDNIRNVYMPILTWYFTYNGKEYQLSQPIQN